MANLNLTMLIRKAKRALKMRGAATDSSLIAAGEPIEAADTEFQQSDKQVRLTATEERKKRTVRDSIGRALGRVYNKVRSTVLARMPYADVPGRASSLETLDDVLNFARKLEELLLKIAGVDESHPVNGQGESAPNGEPWALPVVQELSAQIAVTTQAYDEAVVAGEILKKTIDDRADKRDALESHFRAFRRVVKDVYGPQSNEYMRLRDRGEPGEDDEDEAPVVTPPPAEHVPAA